MNNTPPLDLDAEVASAREQDADERVQAINRGSRFELPVIIAATSLTCAANVLFSQWMTGN